MPYIKDASGNYLPSPTITGADGREVLLRNNGTAIQWRYSDTEWADLAYLDELAGADGREVELGLGTTHLQWHYVDDPSWTNLIALSDITGPRGYTGPANVLQIGTVQGGDNAAATITGSAPSQTLNLVLPKGDPSTVPGPTGRGIVSIDRTAGTGAPGTVDTYTITYTNETTSTFSVYNGLDGAGSVNLFSYTFTSASWTLTGDWYVLSIDTSSYNLGANFIIDVYPLIGEIYVKSHGHFYPPDWQLEMNSATGAMTLKTTAAFSGKIVIIG